MDESEFELINDYVEQEDEEIYDDFEEILSTAKQASDGNTAFTSGSLPKGFETDRYKNPFRFEALNTYDLENHGGEGTISVEYEEKQNLSFTKEDTAKLEITVEPVGFRWSDSWNIEE
jgi:hypothetical protein